MNNLQKSVEDIGKEFDKMVVVARTPRDKKTAQALEDAFHILSPQIKNFISHSIKKVLGDFVKETKVQEAKEMKDVYSHGHSGCCGEEIEGFNLALSAVQSKQREYLGE